MACAEACGEVNVCDGAEDEEGDEDDGAGERGRVVVQHKATLAVVVGHDGLCGDMSGGIGSGCLINQRALCCGDSRCS